MWLPQIAEELELEWFRAEQRAEDRAEIIDITKLDEDITLALENSLR